MTQLTIIAILVGPVLAVLVTRWVDGLRAKIDRRWDIFRALMRHRRTPMHFEFVGALNLVEVEFAKSPAVIAAWKDLLGKFDPIALGGAGQEHLKQMDDRRAQSQARLLNAIANQLGVKVEQLDIFAGGYSPQGWADMEREFALIRHWLAGIASGSHALPVVAYPPPSDGSEGHQ